MSKRQRAILEWVKSLCAALLFFALLVSLASLQKDERKWSDGAMPYWTTGLYEAMVRSALTRSPQEWEQGLREWIDPWSDWRVFPIAAEADAAYHQNVTGNTICDGIYNTTGGAINDGTTTVRGMKSNDTAFSDFGTATWHGPGSLWCYSLTAAQSNAAWVVLQFKNTATNQFSNRGINVPLAPFDASGYPIASLAPNQTIGSVTTVTGNVNGSLVGNVGGNVNGSVALLATTASAAVADAVWDEAYGGHNSALTFGYMGNLIDDIDTDITGVNGVLDLQDQTLTAVAGLPSAASNADAVWDEVAADHNNSTLMGGKMNAAASAGDPWSTAIPGAYGAGTAGNIVGNRLDAAISTRLNATAAVASVTGAVGSVTGNVGGSIGGSLLGSVAGNVNGSVGSVSGDVGGKVLGGGAGTITGTGARVVDASGNNVAPAATALSTATWTAGRAAYIDKLNTHLDASVSSRLATSGYTAPPTAADNADAVWDESAAAHNNATQMGGKLNAAGTAGDPWATALPGAYEAGTAGYLLSNVSAGADPGTIADAVWDEPALGHNPIDSMGFKIFLIESYGGDIPGLVTDMADVLDRIGEPANGSLAADILAVPDAVWLSPLPGAYTAGTGGYVLGNLIDLLGAAYGTGPWSK